MCARLEAQLNGQDEMRVPQTGLSEQQSDQELTAIVERQRSELRARRASLLAEENVLTKEIADFRRASKAITPKSNQPRGSLRFSPRS